MYKGLLFFDFNKMIEVLKLPNPQNYNPLRYVLFLLAVQAVSVVLFIILIISEQLGSSNFMIRLIIFEFSIIIFSVIGILGLTYSIFLLINKYKQKSVITLLICSFIVIFSGVLLMVL